MVMHLSVIVKDTNEYHLIIYETAGPKWFCKCLNTHHSIIKLQKLIDIYLVLLNLFFRSGYFAKGSYVENTIVIINDRKLCSL